MTDIVASTLPTHVPQIDDDWRRWIAENLMLEGVQESLLVTLTVKGFEIGRAGRRVTNSRPNAILPLPL